MNNLTHHSNTFASGQIDSNHDPRYCRYCQPQDADALTETERQYRFRQGYRTFGYVATAVKHGIDQCTALNDLTHGWPWMPPAPAAPT